MWILWIAVFLAGLKFLVWADVLQSQAIASVSWGWVIGVFFLSALWFEYEDQSGLRKKKAMEEIERRKQERVQKAKNELYQRRKH